MITKETIIEFFNDLKSKEDFNTEAELLWGYFFLDKDTEKLKELSEKLEKDNYRFVEFFEAEKLNKKDPQEYYLHLEKIEHHTIDSLNERNQYLYKIAEEMNVSLYDGFDVGNIGE